MEINNQFLKGIQAFRLFSIFLFIAVMLTACAGKPIRALLPMVDTVPALQPTQIDGVWKISSNNKRIRIDRGRAYAIDGWLHLGTLQIHPNMVVFKNIKEDGAGGYVGYDLPLMGNWQASRTADGSLNVTVAGSFGPVSYRLLAVEQNDFIDDEFDDSHRKPFPPIGFPLPVDPIRRKGTTVAQIGKHCYEDFKPMGRTMLKYGSCKLGLRNLNVLRKTIKSRDAEGAKSFFNAITCRNEFNNMVYALRRKGFKSVSLGVAGDVSLIIGGSGEALVASNLDLSNTSFYGTVGGGVSSQAGASLNGVVTAYYAPANQLSGKGKSFSISLKVLGGAGGTVGLSRGKSPRCESFSATVGTGIGANVGSVNSSRTFKLAKLDFIHKPDFSASCKDVTVKIKNRTGYAIKIVDIDFYDYLNKRWRSKIIKNTKVKKGRNWSKKLRLQKVGGDRTRVKIQYRVKNKGGLINKWSKVVSRKTAVKTCKAGIQFSKVLK